MKCPPPKSYRVDAGNPLLERYGMTETGMVLSNPLDPILRIPGTVGYPLPGVEIRIISPENRTWELLPGATMPQHPCSGVAQGQGFEHLTGPSPSNTGNTQAVTEGIPAVGPNPSIQKPDRSSGSSGRASTPGDDSREGGKEERASDGAGELLVRGSALFSEYWRRPEATAEAFTADGFFRTGAQNVVITRLLFKCKTYSNNHNTRKNSKISK